jgi:hypothetical protein
MQQLMKDQAAGLSGHSIDLNRYQNPSHRDPKRTQSRESAAEVLRHVMGSDTTDYARLVAGIRGVKSLGNMVERQVLEIIAECDRTEVWRDDDCWDLAQWLATQMGITNLKAKRLINVTHVLPTLPLTSAAFERGQLSMDQIIELCRFATPETEAELITWARRVSVAAIRSKAEAASHTDKKEAAELDKQRWLNYWYFEDRKLMGLQGCFPADQGAVIAKALDRAAGRLPDIVGDDDDHITDLDGSLEMRRADAFYEMASRAIAEDQDPDRATVVVHAELDALIAATSGCEVENGPVIHPETARRLLCDSRLQSVVHNGDGGVIGIGRTSRTIPTWLLRQLRYRDKSCSFPGCHKRYFLHAHHIRHWMDNGTTDLDNLTLSCHYHHKLLHEYGWAVSLRSDNVVRWYRPNGEHYVPGDP